MNTLTALDLADHIGTLVEPLPHTTYYIGHVPDQVPLVGGYMVNPYIVAWPGIEDDHPEQGLGGCGTGEQTLIQLTVVAHDAATVSAVATQVRRRIHKQATPDGGQYRVIPTGQVPQADPDPTLKPRRHYVPLMVEATTIT